MIHVLISRYWIQFLLFVSRFNSFFSLGDGSLFAGFDDGTVCILDPRLPSQHCVVNSGFFTLVVIVLAVASIYAAFYLFIYLFYFMITIIIIIFIKTKNNLNNLKIVIKAKKLFKIDVTSRRLFVSVHNRYILTASEITYFSLSARCTQFFITAPHASRSKHSRPCIFSWWSACLGFICPLCVFKTEFRCRHLLVVLLFFQIDDFRGSP
jgi:hypothetical protein